MNPFICIQTNSFFFLNNNRKSSFTFINVITKKHRSLSDSIILPEIACVIIQSVSLWQAVGFDQSNSSRLELLLIKLEFSDGKIIENQLQNLIRRHTWKIPLFNIIRWLFPRNFTCNIRIWIGFSVTTPECSYLTTYQLINTNASTRIRTIYSKYIV